MRPDILTLAIILTKTAKDLRRHMIVYMLTFDADSIPPVCMYDRAWR